MGIELRFSGTSLLIGLINTPLGEIYRYEAILERDMQLWNQHATRQKDEHLDGFQVASNPEDFHKPSGYLAFGPWSYICLTIVGEQGLATKLANSRGASGQHFFNANDFSFVIPAEIKEGTLSFQPKYHRLVNILKTFKQTYAAQVAKDSPLPRFDKHIHQQFPCSYYDPKKACYSAFYPLKLKDISSRQLFGAKENQLDYPEEPHSPTDDLLYLLKIKLNPILKIHNPRANRLLASLLTLELIYNAYEKIPETYRPSFLRLFSVDGFYDCTLVMRGRFLTAMSNIVQYIDKTNLYEIPKCVKDLLSDTHLTSLDEIRGEQTYHTPLIQISYSVVGLPPKPIKHLFNAYRACHQEVNPTQPTSPEHLSKESLKRHKKILFEALSSKACRALKYYEEPLTDANPEFNLIYPTTDLSMKVGMLESSKHLIEKWYQITTDRNNPFRIPKSHIKQPTVYVHTGRYDIEIFRLKSVSKLTDKNHPPHKYKGLTFGQFAVAHQLAKWLTLGEHYFDKFIDKPMTLIELCNKNHAFLRFRAELLEIRTRFMLLRESHTSNSDLRLQNTEIDFEGNPFSELPKHLGVLDIVFIRRTLFNFASSIEKKGNKSLEKLIKELEDSKLIHTLTPDQVKRNYPQSLINKAKQLTLRELDELIKVYKSIKGSRDFFKHFETQALSNTENAHINEIGASALLKYLTTFFQDETKPLPLTHETIETIFTTLSALDEKLKDPMSFYYYIDLVKYVEDFYQTLFSIGFMEDINDINLFYYSYSTQNVTYLPKVENQSMVGLESWLMRVSSNLQKVIGQRQIGVYPHHDRDFSRLSDVRVFHAKKIIGISWLINDLLKETTTMIASFWQKGPAKEQLGEPFVQSNFTEKLKKLTRNVSHPIHTYLSYFGNSPEMVLHGHTLSINARHFSASESLLIIIHEVGHIVAEHLDQLVNPNTRHPQGIKSDDYESIPNNHRNQFWARMTLSGHLIRNGKPTVYHEINALNSDNNNDEYHKPTTRFLNPELALLFENTRYFDANFDDIWSEIFSDLFVYRVAHSPTADLYFLPHDNYGNIDYCDTFLLAWVFQILRGPATQRLIAFKVLLLRLTMSYGLLKALKNKAIPQQQRHISIKRSMAGSENFMGSQELWSKHILPFFKGPLCELVEAFLPIRSPNPNLGLQHDRFWSWFCTILKNKPLEIPHEIHIRENPREYLELFWHFELENLFHTYYNWFLNQCSQKPFFYILASLCQTDETLTNNKYFRSQYDSGENLPHAVHGFTYGLRPDTWNKELYSGSFAAATQVAAVVSMGFLFEIKNKKPKLCFDSERLIVQEGHVGFKNHRLQQSLGRARRMINNVIWDGSLDAIRNYLERLRRDQPDHETDEIP